MIGPVDIERVQFKTTRVKEGYDQDEVDAFLDRAADALKTQIEYANKAEGDNVRLRSEVATLKRQLQAYTDAPTGVLELVKTEQPEPTAMAGRLLELAQQTADEVTARAQREAADIAARARAIADETLEEAQREANEKRRAAEVEAYNAEQRLVAAKASERRQRDFLHSVAAEVTAAASKLEG